MTDTGIYQDKVAVNSVINILSDIGVKLIQLFSGKAGVTVSRLHFCIRAFIQ